MATNGKSTLGDLFIPLEQGPDGAPNSQHTRSPTAISIAPSESATLSGATGSSILSGSKIGALERLPEVGPLPQLDGPLRGSQIPTHLTVPAQHKNRTLVLCFDGTGDQFDSDNSNVVELFGSLKKDDPEKQMVYYQAGIGTYTTPQVATPLMARFSKTLDEMVAWNLDAHIMGGYEFLMQNYKARDKICIFGFSRGAYTARCLAGMIHKVGLLPPCNHNQVPFAYKMYTRTDELGWKQSNAFKRAFAINVGIDFLGVWDTVSSVGIIPRTLPFTTSNNCVRVFRHAISLDERRARFKENAWNIPTERESKLSVTDREDDEHLTGHYHCHTDHARLNSKKAERHMEREYSIVYPKPTDVEEVWFAGCHCDVGGGSVENGTRPALARIPLRWLVRQTFTMDTGIMYSARGLRKLGLDLDPTTFEPILKRPAALELPPNTHIEHVPPPQHLARKEREDRDRGVVEVELGLTEEQIDLRDALSPVYDQLQLAKWWWILEIMPTRHHYQDEHGSWTSWLGMNLGRGRHIPRQTKHGVKIHRTVKTRLEATYADGSKYFPRANVNLDKVTWVD